MWIVALQANFGHFMVCLIIFGRFGHFKSFL